MKKFKITKGDRVYIVDAKSHIDAISKVKAVKDAKFLTENKEADKVKDSAIKDYSPEVYVNELEKLVTEYDKFRNLKEKLKQFYSETGKTKFSDIENDARFKQWAKGVTDINNRWNAVIENLNRFGVHGYRMDSDISSIWWNTLPDRYMLKAIRYNINSTAKFNKNKDSISQWNPGMSEIGLFQISYKRNGVYQSILVRANSEEQAKQKLLNNLNGVDIIGVNSHPSPHFHEPILDSSIKDAWSGIRSNGVIFNYSDGKYTITHKNGKVETFPGNKFNTVEELFKYIDNIKDSAIKDMPLMFKSNVNMQSLKSNIDNVKNKPNETYINSLNANIQGIIADIEEIKGYEKEGKFNESPALKFSCKNLTAQYYKLLNDPKLQGTLHKLDVPTYKNVLYAEHQAQMLSQVTLK